MRGALVLSPAVWCGFFDGVLVEVPGRVSVALKALGARRLELLFTPY